MIETPSNELSSSPRPVWQSMRRGMARRCPRCGAKTLFQGYTKISDHCGDCGLDLTGQRADDGPPYFTMLIVGHALAIPIVEVKRHLDPPLGLQLLIWLSIGIAMTLILLPMTKGALVGLQWAKHMHGFASEEDHDPEATLRP